jgi:xanthine dehydrogenase YagT iron-sulfur-binding subunit
MISVFNCNLLHLLLILNFWVNDMNPPLLPENVDRRTFLATGSLGAAAMSMGNLAAAPLDNPPEKESDGLTVTLNINQKEHRISIDPRMTLLDCLREKLNLTGTKKGCDHGQCGACTVHIDGQRVNSCLCLAIAYQDTAITTIEGLGSPEQMHPMQEAFVACDAYQCGYCTSGQIMSAVALLNEPIGKSDVEIREALSGNICRCGAYTNILAAVRRVQDKQAAG